MSETDMILKITALDLLSKADYPLNNKQITEFFIDGNYTDYFNVQQVISSLVDTKMIEMEQGANESQYRITDEGLETLELFRERITESIEEEIKSFYAKNSLQMKKENSVFSDYYRSANGGFYVHLRMMEENKNIMDFTFQVMTEAQAEAICTNWKQKYEDVYGILMDHLM